MKNINFRNRLIIGFIALVALTITIAIYSVSHTIQLKSNTTLLYNHPLKVSNAVREINSNIHIIHKTMKDIAMLKDTNSISGKLDIIDLYNTKTLESFEIIYSQYLGKKRDIDQAYKSYINWEVIRNEVIQNIRGGKYDEASQITMGKGAIHVNFIIEQMRHLANFAENKAIEVYNETLMDEQQALFRTYALIGIILVLSIVLVIILSNAISKPIMTFTQEMTRIFNSNQQKSNIPTNITEIQALELIKTETENLINNLNKKSYELRKLNENLEEKVKDRTKELKTREDELIEKNHEYESLVEELRQSNMELENAIAKAEESDRLKSAFLANMSHEIRTPLNAILGFNSLTLKRKDLDQESKRYNTIIQKSANQLLSIVNDVLDISFIETGQSKIHQNTVHLESMLQEIIIPYMSAGNDSDVSYEVKLPKNRVQVVSLDEMKIRQIFNNLLNNATRYTEKGKISIGYYIEENNLVFFTQDSGCGMPQVELNKIFDRFYQIPGTVSTEHRGTGLGLSICRGFTELLGGKIWASSEEGKGTEFYFQIPLKISSEKNSEETVSELSPALLKKKIKILIAEDEAMNFSYLKEVYSDYDFDITHAWNGEEAVKLITSGEKFDLILMDIKMPKLDGYQACNKIKEYGSNTPIIAQTAYALEKDKIKLKEHFDAFITKPTDANQLIDLTLKYLTQN